MLGKLFSSGCWFYYVKSALYSMPKNLSWFEKQMKRIMRSDCYSCPLCLQLYDDRTILKHLKMHTQPKCNQEKKNGAVRKYYYELPTFSSAQMRENYKVCFVKGCQ